METRASHILVGGFVLLLLFSLVGFTIWIAKVDLDAEYTDYNIYMPGSVFGLVKRSVVYYQGIPVGEVRDIDLNPNDPSQVRILVSLDSDVPVIEGTSARLEYQGFTGVGFIEIRGGPAGAPLLQVLPGEDRAVIPAEASSFQEVFEGAPSLINEAIAAVQQIQKLLADDNLRRISETLDHVALISANIENATNDLDTVVTTTRTTLEEIRTAAAEIGALAETGQEIVDEEARLLVEETTKTMAQATELLGRVDDLVGANDETITQFIATSLPEVSRMITDLRATSRNLNKLMARLEENPLGAILDPGKPEYDLKSRTAEKD